ncbi:MAG: vanadium-dependent haloperoxidase [Pseudomonadota bacterium]
MNDYRRAAARTTRVRAADLALSREIALPSGQMAIHKNNGDEALYREAPYAMSFTKGLYHDPTTLLARSVADGDALRAAIDAGLVDNFNKIDRPPGEKRQWEAPTAGFVHDLQGPDAQEVTMAPAPELGSAELTYEMAEVYELALLRDVGLDAFAGPHGAGNAGVLNAVDRMNALAVRLGVNDHQFPSGRRRKTDNNGLLTPQTLFRGSSRGVEEGGYLSQFMFIGNAELGGQGRGPDAGQILYGVQLIDQTVPVAEPKLDFMASEADYLAVQNGLSPNPQPYVQGARRLIATPRDLATYVHFDALYQAYLNACLILLGQRAPFDPNFDKLSGMGGFKEANAGGFALWGGPHILSLVTEVATRGLKAVRYQKFNNHLRLRPEALAARVHKAGAMPNVNGLKDRVQQMVEYLKADPGNDVKPLLEAVTYHNNRLDGDTDTVLLPMAFPEGSPMHPAYGAGHATVAGACVTILKAFFDTSAVLMEYDDANSSNNRKVAFGHLADVAGKNPTTIRFELDENGVMQEPIRGGDPLTLEGELNKLAANISIGRNMAGVHYFSDYVDSLRMGEQVAIGILEEQALTYPLEPFVVSLEPFDQTQGTIVIGT